MVRGIQVQVAPMKFAISPTIGRGNNTKVHGQCKECGGSCFSNMNTEILPAKRRAGHILPKATKTLAVLVSSLKE